MPFDGAWDHVPVLQGRDNGSRASVARTERPDYSAGVLRQLEGWRIEMLRPRACYSRSGCMEANSLLRPVLAGADSHARPPCAIMMGEAANMTPRARHMLLLLAAILGAWPWAIVPLEAGDGRDPASPTGAAVSDVRDGLPFVLATWPTERRAAMKGERLDGCPPALPVVLVAQADSNATLRRETAQSAWGPPGRPRDCAALCRFLV